MRFEVASTPSTGKPSITRVKPPKEKDSVVTTLAKSEPVIVPADGWEHKGIVYKRGDYIKISGESGIFIFMSYNLEKSGREVIDTWWVGRHMRSFHVDRIMAPKVKSIRQRKEKTKTMKVCDTHPSYGAVRKPRTDCSSCWAAYNSKQGA